MTNDLEELKKLLGAGTRYFPLAWQGDANSLKVFADDARLIADIRGWGYLTGRGDGALGLSEGEAVKAQGDLLALIVAAINALPSLIERVERAEAALRLFMGAATPVSTEIDPRGYVWSPAYLDQARAALNPNPTNDLKEQTGDGE